jgi:hypothetical protein
MMLLGVAGVIALASVVAIVFAVKGTSGGNKDVVFDNGSNVAPAPETSIAPAGTGSAATSAAPADSSGGDVPPLNGGATPHPAPHANPGPSPVPGPSPAPPHTTPTPTTPPQPTLTTPPPVPTPAPTPAPGRYDGPECQKARTLKAIGHPKEALVWAQRCLAAGGAP